MVPEQIGVLLERVGLAGIGLTVTFVNADELPQPLTVAITL